MVPFQLKRLASPPRLSLVVISQASCEPLIIIMPFWTLVLLIAVAWLSYPIVGALGVAASIAEGARPKDAGFSFLPELIVFPPLFLGVAMLIDYFAMPWGRWIISSLCIAMLAFGLIACIRNALVIRRSNNPR